MAHHLQGGDEHVKTKVFMMLPPEQQLLEIDVQDYMWKDDSSDADAPWLLEEAFMG